MQRIFWRALMLLMVGSNVSLAADGRDPLVVFAAASLTDVLQKAADDFTDLSGIKVKLSFAASSALAKQIESGARADVFISADQDWMNYLDERKLIDGSSRADLLGNRLVLIAPSHSKVQLKLGTNAPLLKELGNNGKLATGDPDSVPAGKYARAALMSLELWNAVQRRIARTDNVRVALMYVARGEVPLGIVYATDAAAEPKVKVVDTFPAATHAPITYPVAMTQVARPHAKTFFDFLRGPTAGAIFEKAGFTVLSATTADSGI